MYDNIVFFASGAEKLSGVTFDELLEFSNDGGNILLGLHKEVSDSVRDFVQSLGMTVHKKNSEVIDHFHHSLTTDLRYCCCTYVYFLCVDLIWTAVCSTSMCSRTAQATPPQSWAPTRQLVRASCQ